MHKEGNSIINNGNMTLFNNLIASISEEPTAGVHQISASSEQMSSSIEEVANNSKDLAKLAENLNVLVNRFVLYIK